MKQALHIFRKDARRFRYEIAVSVVFTAAFACAQIFAGLLPNVLHWAMSGLVVIWWPLICLLMQEESLIGDRQFWITRPYSRAGLLAAKALFIVTFISVPLLLAQSAILVAAGFQPFAYLPSFLWVHVVFFASILLPAVALASVTRNLGQAVLTFFGIVAALIVVGLVAGNSVSGTRYTASAFVWADTLTSEVSLIGPVLVILILQWTMRKRWLALTAGAASFLLVELLTGNLDTALGTGVQARMFGDRGAGQTAVIMNGYDVGRDGLADRKTIPVMAGFRVVDMPAGLLAKPEIIELTFEDSRGERWSSGWISVMSSGADVYQRDPDSDRAFAWSQNIWLDRQFARRVGSSLLTVHGSVWLMLNARRIMNLPDNRRTLVPGGGACTVHNAHNARFLDCASPFHDTFSATNGFAFWDSPVPETFSLSPLSWFSTRAVRLGNFACVYYEPRAYIHRYFSATNVRLP